MPWYWCRLRRSVNFETEPLRPVSPGPTWFLVTLVSSWCGFGHHTNPVHPWWLNWARWIWCLGICIYHVVIDRVHKSSIQRDWKSIPVQVPPVTTCLEDALVEMKHLPNNAIGPFNFQVFQVLVDWLVPESVKFQLLCQFLDLVVDVVMNLVVASPVTNFLECSIHEVLVASHLSLDCGKITPGR